MKWLRDVSKYSYGFIITQLIGKVKRWALLQTNILMSMGNDQNKTIWFNSSCGGIGHKTLKLAVSKSALHWRAGQLYFQGFFYWSWVMSYSWIIFDPLHVAGGPRVWSFILDDIYLLWRWTFESMPVNCLSIGIAELPNWIDGSDYLMHCTD